MMSLLKPVDTKPNSHGWLVVFYGISTLVGY